MSIANDLYTCQMNHENLQRCQLIKILKYFRNGALATYECAMNHPMTDQRLLIKIHSSLSDLATWLTLLGEEVDEPLPEDPDTPDNWMIPNAATIGAPDLMRPAMPT